MELNEDSQDYSIDHSHDHSHEHEDHSHGKGIIAKVMRFLSLGHKHEHHHEYDLAKNSKDGIKALKISFLGLMITAFFQFFIVLYTGSVALLADTVHNFSDALTAIPLWIAYRLNLKQKSKKYPYGYGRAEDLAGLFIILMIAFSAFVVFWESVRRLYNPIELDHLGILALSGIIGFLGNELVAKYRIGVGKRISSEALVADGMHARTDGLTSLAVLVGALGAYFGYPIVDPIVGIIIGFMILMILKDTTSTLWFRLMDRADLRLIEKIERISKTYDGIAEIHEIKTRSSGQSLFAELHIVMNREYTIEESHEITTGLQEGLRSEIQNLVEVIVYPIPCSHQ
ncbi:MAG: cation diffusion facilitator family transporter [Candidatus Kariarchaeaceae archaeon]